MRPFTVDAISSWTLCETGADRNHEKAFFVSGLGDLLRDIGRPGRDDDEGRYWDGEAVGWVDWDFFSSALEYDVLEDATGWASS